MKKPQYPLHQLIFYKMSTKARLYVALFPKHTVKEGAAILKEILRNKENLYDCWDDNGRIIEHPNQSIKRIHKRISIIFGRVMPPDFLHSAYKKRSYVTNAKTHIGANELQKVDVKRFFPSTSKQHIKNFFRKELKCSFDVAAIMADLLTYKDHLPTGSPISPILSYWAHSTTFSKIASYCKDRSLLFTLYVDDLALSGEKVNSSDLDFVLKTLKRNALNFKRQKIIKYNKGDTKKITGIIVKVDNIYPPNGRHKELNDLIEQAVKNPTLLKLKSFQQQLDGRLTEIKQINPEIVVKIERKLSGLKSSLVPAKSKVTPH